MISKTKTLFLAAALVSVASVNVQASFFDNLYADLAKQKVASDGNITYTTVAGDVEIDDLIAAASVAVPGAGDTAILATNPGSPDVLTALGVLTDRILTAPVAAGYPVVDPPAVAGGSSLYERLQALATIVTPVPGANANVQTTLTNAATRVSATALGATPNTLTELLDVELGRMTHAAPVSVHAGVDALKALVGGAGNLVAAANDPDPANDQTLGGFITAYRNRIANPAPASIGVGLATLRTTLGGADGAGADDPDPANAQTLNGTATAILNLMTNGGADIVTELGTLRAVIGGVSAAAANDADPMVGQTLDGTLTALNVLIGDAALPNIAGGAVAAVVPVTLVASQAQLRARLRAAILVEEAAGGLAGNANGITVPNAGAPGAGASLTELLAHILR